MRITGAVLALALSGTWQIAQAADEDFDVESMVSELESQLEVTAAELEAMRPVLEEKSRQLKSAVNGTVEKGYMELETLSADMKAASARAESRLQEALSSEEVAELKAYLARLDGDALEEIQRSLVEEITRLLELTSEQLNAVVPLLEQDLQQRAELLDEFIGEAGRSFSEYEERVEQLGDKTGAELEKLLESDQMERLRARWAEIEDKVRQELFSG